MTLKTGTAGPPIRANTMEPEVYRQLINMLVQTQGVANVNDFKVSQRGAGANMSVDVASGFAIIAGGNSAPVQGSYNCYNDATVNLAIAASDPTNPRIDIVVVTIRDAFYSGASNDVILQVVTGTPAGSPVAPATPTNSLLLANVAVAAAASSIVNANITDKRVTIGLNGSVNWNANSVGPMRDLGSVNKWTPAGGPYQVGDMIFDYGYMGWWVCTVAGSPGTWKLSSAAYIRASVHASAAQADTSAAFVDLQLNTKDEDLVTAFNTGTYSFTCPIAGTYKVSAFSVNANNTLGDRTIQVVKGGVSYRILGQQSTSAAPSGNTGPGGSTNVICAASDVLKIQVKSPGATAGAWSGGWATFEYVGPA